MISKRNIFLASGMAAAVCLTVGAMVATAEAPASADIQPGAAAPAFTGLSASGETVSLSDYDGQIVVLEWTNHDCPFVRKHYDDEMSNMQSIQEEAEEAGVVWLSVISSAPGKQGHVSADQANELTTSRAALPDHVLLDEDGTIGRAYNAKTTPHMFVINAEGIVEYNGAIDSNPSARVADIPTAEPYFVMALNDVVEGRTPDPAATKPYGCSVKY